MALLLHASNSVRPLNGIVVGFNKHNRNEAIILCENGHKLTTIRSKEIKLGIRVEILLEVDTLKIISIRKLLPNREELEDDSIQIKLSKIKGDIDDQDYYDRQTRYSPTNR
jgi:hypothetical protein